MLRFRPPRIALALVVLAALAHWVLGPAVVLQARPIAGMAIAAVGLLVMLAGWRLFVRAGVAICPTARTERLVTDGIYRLTRNPMYLGMVLMLVGLATGVGTLPFFVAAGAYFTVLDRVFCRYEEAKLLACFGSAYLDYARRVRRWV
ncbi:MAG: isoprenylcysteine carboxylmethyltransferase family protein [Vicinamibacterales bacterium]